jgi:hypothetical protein
MKKLNKKGELIFAPMKNNFYFSSFYDKLFKEFGFGVRMHELGIKEI